MNVKDYVEDALNYYIVNVKGCDVMKEGLTMYWSVM